jgi:hypothetical protein
MLPCKMQLLLMKAVNKNIQPIATAPADFFDKHADK